MCWKPSLRVGSLLSWTGPLRVTIWCCCHHGAWNGPQLRYESWHSRLLPGESGGRWLHHGCCYWVQCSYFFSCQKWEKILDQLKEKLDLVRLTFCICAPSLYRRRDPFPRLFNFSTFHVPNVLKSPCLLHKITKYNFTTLCMFYVCKFICICSPLGGYTHMSYRLEVSNFISWLKQ